MARRSKPDAENAPPLAETEAQWRRGNVGRLMFDGARRFEERLHASVRAAGFAEVRYVHLTVLRNMNLGGTRLTELAARAGMTKQAMGQQVDDCESLGIVTRRADEADRRARLIAFTPRGRALLDVVHRAIAEAEAEMAAAVGKRAFAQVREALAAYVRGAETRDREAAA
jgi:DNA-binding MarR family transcriptional regulator